MKEFEPGNVCYYTTLLKPERQSVIVISPHNSSTGYLVRVCPLGGGSTFEVDYTQLVLSDGSTPSGTIAAPPDSQITLIADGRRRQK